MKSINAQTNLRGVDKDEKHPTLEPTQNNKDDLLPLIPLHLYEEYFAENGKGGGEVTCTVYSMSQYDQNYQTPEILSSFDRWALHALQWKAYVHADSPTEGSWDENHPSISEDELETQVYQLTTQNCNVPTGFLNNAEASGLYQDSEGNNDDPDGIWVCKEPTPRDGYVGALIAAMNMHYFKTPTYTDIRDEYFNPNFSYLPFYAHKAAIERVTLCVEGDQPVHEVCGWDEDWFESYENIGSGGCAADIDGEETEVDVVLDSVTFSAFTVPEDGTFIPNFTVSGLYWAGIYGRFLSPDVNHLVFDPPSGTTEKELMILEERAKQLSKNLLVAKGDFTIKDDVWIGKQAEGEKLMKKILGKK